MKYKVIILILLFTTTFSFAQKEKVIVTEKKQGKRITLFAENTTKDTLNIFIMLTAQGYRRSADRPVVMDLAPKKKINIMTLIEMDDQESSYTYNVIVNEKQKNAIPIDPDKEVADIETLIKGKVVLFTKVDCPKCETLSAFLFKEQINHRVFTIDKDPKLYRQFMNMINKELREDTQIRFPIVWNKTYTIFGYEELEEIVQEMKRN